MGVNLSIKDVPDKLAQRLRERAARNHRSLQGELMAIVEAAALDSAAPVTATEPGGAYSISPQPQAVRHGGDTQPAADLLAALDAIVAGTQWGEAPLLTREQLHDRQRVREADLQTREAELARARARIKPQSAHRRDA